MKKILALCLSAVMALSLLTSCDDGTTPTDTSETPAESTYTQNYVAEGAILKSCLGQADENGVYVVPDTITMIAEGAFAGDESIREIVIGANVETIGSGAFQYCRNLEKVTIEEGAQIIGSYAFYGCSSLREVSLPSTVKTLEEYTFYGCEALETISLEHIETIGNSAFLYCSALESVTLSPALKVIDAWAFAQCSALEDISMENLTALTTIGDYSFASCSMLKSIEIPEGVESIGILAFYNCSKLTSVSIPSTVTKVDYAAFHYTPWYQENAEDYLIVGDGVLIKCAVHPTRLDLTDKGIKVIGGAAFRNAEMEGESAEYGYKYASALEEIKIPDGVTVIGTGAFAGCVYLKNVVLPSTVLRIEDNAFNIYSEGFEPTATVNFQVCEGLTYIGSYAFYGCGGIETIDLPETVNEVGAYAFAMTAAYDSFLEQAKNETEEKNRYLISGDGVLLAAYVADGQTSITVPDGVKVIAGTVFCGWDSAYIPGTMEGLSTSGVSKYNLSYHVTEVNLPDTLEVIGPQAFYRMVSLKKIVFPASLRKIDSDAFGFCEELSDISGGANIETISDYAFYYCAALPNFSFSSNTTEIGTGVFYGCSSLKTVRFPQGLENPGTSLFDDMCTSLTKITLDSSARPLIYSILGTVAQEIDISYYKD